MAGDDPLDNFEQDPAVWTLDQELNVAAEVYGSEPKGIFSADLDDEALVERFRTLLGFDVMWEPPAEPGGPEAVGPEAVGPERAADEEAG